MSLFSEAVLVSTCLGLTTGLTTWVLLRTVKSPWLALYGGALVVLAFPRGYAYPKLLVMALAVSATVWWIERESRAARIALSLVVAIAFLFRHDLGVIVGLAVGAAVIAHGSRHDLIENARTAAVILATAGLLLVPYALYVQVNGGWGLYINTLLQANSEEAGYAWPNPFVDRSPEAVLLYVFHALPWLTLLVVALDSKDKEQRFGAGERFAVGVAALAIAANFGLLRQPLAARVPDVIVPAALLIVWLAGRVVARQKLVEVAVACVVCFLLGRSVFALGSGADAFRKARLQSVWAMTPANLTERFTERAAGLRSRFGPHANDDVVASLRSFFTYLDRCAPTDARLFLGGMIPEVAYYARRPFGGGAYEHYNYKSRDNQQLVVRRLTERPATFALIPSDTEAALYQGLPIVGTYVASHYRPLTMVSMGERGYVTILIDRELVSGTPDPETGWPCQVRTPASS